MADPLQRPFNSWDALKVLALLLMFVDHSGAFFYTDQAWLRAIGRGAAPIFMFLTGYASSYRFRKELLALAVLLSISDFLLAGHLRTQNILVTILITRVIFDWLEHHGKRIERPYEWVAGAIALIITSLFTQYGSYGFLFALCGYLQRRKDEYPSQVRRNVMIVSFLFYSLLMASFYGFAPVFTTLLVLVMGPLFYLMWTFRIAPVDHCPPALLRAGKLVSIYSGYIYAFHLIALEWATGIPF